MSNIKITELNNGHLTEVQESEMTKVVGGRKLFSLTLNNVGSPVIQLNVSNIIQTLTKNTSAAAFQDNFSIS